MQTILPHGRHWIGAILLAAMLSISTAAAQDSALFYYANGERIPLTISTDYVAAQITAGGTVGMDSIEQSFAQVADAAAPVQPGLIAGQDFYLLPVENVGNAAGARALVESMRASSLTLDWVNPVYRYEQFDLVLTREFIAGFPAGTTRDEIDGYNAANGVEYVRDLMPDVYVLRVTPASGVDALAMANRYEEGGFAAYGEPNWSVLQPNTIATQTSTPVEAAASADEGGRMGFAPNDPLRNNAWHLRNYDQWQNQASYPQFHDLVITPDADIDAYELDPEVSAWDVSLGSSSTIIAILDSGVETAHPDLSAKIVSPRDVVGNDNDPNPFDTGITSAYDGHGTQLAGLAAATTNNGVGVSGMCPNCSIMPIRIFYSYLNGSEVDLFATIATTVAGIDYARTNGAHVLNLAWSDNPSTSITVAIRNAALNGRGGLGSVIVSSAGYYNSASSFTTIVTYPGRVSSVISGMLTVGTSTWCDSIKFYNPSGGAIDCSGFNSASPPGSEVNIAAPSHWLPSTDLTGANGYVTGDYAYLTGTSGSVAIVSGAAGLLLSAEPTLTSDQVRDRLMLTSDPIHTAGYDTNSGWGRLNLNKAMRNIPMNTGTPNDHRTGSTVVSILPFNTTQSVLGAFTDRTDPALACQTSNATISNSVWYTFNPSYTMTVNINTIGSNFDTVMGVYNASMVSVACNDNVSGGEIASSVSFEATGGATYYVLIGDYTSPHTPDGVLGTAVLAVNMSTSTPPPAGFTLTGHVDLQSRPAAPNPALSVQLHVIVKPTSGGTTVFDGTRTTDLDGNFTLSNVQPGTYNVWVKHAHTLANMEQVTITSADVSLNLGTLLEGDADNGNSVSLSDFSLLASSYGTSTGDPNYNASADFNADGMVQLIDFSLLASNYGLTGDAAP